MDIPKLIVLISVSVVLPFQKCLRLFRLGLYTVSAPIVGHSYYISL